jgi:hypothetical protein
MAEQRQRIWRKLSESVAKLKAASAKGEKKLS